MAYAETEGGILVPENMFKQPSFTTVALDADDEKYAVIFQIPETGTITGFGWPTGTVTKGDDVLGRLETVDGTTGMPTGTLYHANASATITVADGDDDTLKEVAWTGFTGTRDDLVAAVFALDSGATANATDIQIRRIDTDVLSNFPYGALFTGTWAKSSIAQETLGVLQYTGGVYQAVHGLLPISGFNALTPNVNSTPDEIGNQFTLPWPVRIDGVEIMGDLKNAMDIVLYDSASTAQRTQSIDKDEVVTGISARNRFYFSTSYDLAKDTLIRVVAKPTISSSISMVDIEVNAAAIMDAMPGGQGIHKTERTNAGAWTDTTTKRALISLIVSGFDDGAGGGGGTTSILGAGGF